MNSDRKYWSALIGVFVVNASILALITGSIPFSTASIVLSEDIADNITTEDVSGVDFNLLELPPKGNPKLDTELNQMISNPNPIPQGPLTSGILPGVTISTAAAVGFFIRMNTHLSK